MSEEEYDGKVDIKTTGKNLFHTIEIGGIKYTDNIPDGMNIGITKEQYIEYLQLQQENKRLKEDLRVSQSNEETYSLEMQEITKILGLDEDTLFDDVKEIVKYLNEEHNKKLKVFMAYDYYHSILRDLEDTLKRRINAYEERQNQGIDLTEVMTIRLASDKDTLDKIQKLKEKYKC